ncbi:MAG TPA: RDD family protein [Actinomycetes bacterium]
MTTADAPNRPDDVAVPVEARSFQGGRAGLVSRSVAAVVDIAVVLIAVVVIYLGAAGVLLIWNPRNPHVPSLPHGAVGTLAVVLAVAYLAVAWTTSGRTVGDQVMGLRVVDGRDRRVGAGRALVRALIVTIIPVGLLWCLVSARQRALWDVLLRTTVVYDWSGRAVVRD